MSIVISQALVISPVAASLSLNNPTILYRNFVTAAGITATSEEDDYPISNVANPLTFPDAQWRATSTAEQELVFTITDFEAINGFGIAGHNLGSAEIAITIEVFTASAWVEVYDGIPANDAPLLFRSEEYSVSEVRFTLATGNEAARIAVVMIAPLLVVQRGIWLGHTPITMGTVTNYVNGMSQAGDFLGRTVLGEHNATSIDLKNLTPDWYRTYFDPFVRSAKTLPFFFAWRPVDYPTEVGFCWLTNNPKPVNQRKRNSASGLNHGLLSVQLAVNGIV
jgi:hypothetical protein